MPGIKMFGSWSPPWEEPAWQKEAGRWIDDQLEDRGLIRHGPVDQFHIEAWSTVMRISTDRGGYFFKAGAPSQHMEPALLEILVGCRPDDSPSLLAIDTDRGWAITADGGPTLRRVLGTTDPRPDFMRLLPQYARYQIDTMRHVGEMMAIGCPDLRLETLPQRFEEVVADEAMLLIESEEVLTRADHRHLLAMRPDVEELCDEVAQSAIPAAIDHSDLHTANVFADGESYTFFDWGDACVSHPFFSLTVTMRALAGDLNSQDPSLHWARDAYLEPLTEFSTMAELRSAFAAAQRLGRFQRSLSWVNVLRSIAPPYLEEDRHTVPAWLWLFLHFPEDTPPA